MQQKYMPKYDQINLYFDASIFKSTRTDRSSSHGDVFHSVFADFHYLSTF